MAHAPAAPAAELPHHGQHHSDMVRPTVQAPPVTPGKVAMWLFLATEVMFFTGLIGSYIVLRSGSPPTAYSELYAPNTDLTLLEGSHAVVLNGHIDHERLDAVAEVVRKANGLGEEDAHRMVHSASEGWPQVVKAALFKEADAEALRESLEEAGAHAKVETLNSQKQSSWPKPYDSYVNPLSIDLTAANTFILICSSVTMVLALSAIQRGDKQRCLYFLVATCCIGAVFLGVQVYEYRQLMLVHYYPVGIGADHHFRPYSSLFASCFFTMTGFHGAHVLGGVVLLSCITLQASRGVYTRERHSPVELAGLYWHFVDLVWIILFTVVYLI